MGANKCDICADETKPLVRPCVNVSCTAKAHSSCLVKHSEEKCTTCQSDIIKRGKFNQSRCLHFLIHQRVLPILTLSMYLLYLYIIISLSFGENFFNYKECSLPTPTKIKWCEELKKLTTCVHTVQGITLLMSDLAVCTDMNNVKWYCEQRPVSDFVAIFLSFILTLPFIIHFIASFISENSTSNNDPDIIRKYNSKYGSLLISIILGITPILYVIQCHVVGFFMLKTYGTEMLKMNNQLIPITFVMGFVINIIIIILGLLIYHHTLEMVETFSDYEFGEIIKDDSA